MSIENNGGRNMKISDFQILKIEKICTSAFLKCLGFFSVNPAKIIIIWSYQFWAVFRPVHSKYVVKTMLTCAQRFKNGFGAPLSQKPPKTTQNHPHRGPKMVSALPYPKNQLTPLKTTHTKVQKRFWRSLIPKTT